jgi:hypothetical protein
MTETRLAAAVVLLLLLLLMPQLRIEAVWPYDADRRADDVWSELRYFTPNVFAGKFGRGPTNIN